MTPEKFEKLKLWVQRETTVTPSNVNDVILKIPNIFMKLATLKSEEDRTLKSLKRDLQQKHRELMHYYKFDYDYKVDSKYELDTYIYGDDVYISIKIEYDRQSVVLSFITDVMDGLNKLGLQVRSYIDIRKLESGIVT